MAHTSQHLHLEPVGNFNMLSSKSANSSYCLFSHYKVNFAVMYFFTPRSLATKMIGVAQEDADVMQRVYNGKYQLVYVNHKALISNTH